jgi:basic membrane protein A and related proteins
VKQPLTAAHRPRTADGRLPSRSLQRRSAARGLPPRARRRALLLPWLVLAALVAACAGRPAPAPTPTAPPAASADNHFVFGLVLVGPQDDHGWSEAHYTGGRYVETHLPDSEMLVLDSLNPDARPEMTLEQGVDAMIAVNARLVFITSDDFSADTALVAEKYPGTVFIHVSGDHVLKGGAPANLGNYMARMEFGKMIAGCTAALATQTGAVAYLGPLVNNETQRLASASFLGARYCYEHFRGKDPAALRFLVQFIGFWFYIPDVTLDPAQVANQLFDHGADVLLSGIDTTEGLTVAAGRAAADEAVWAVPYDYEGACAGAPAVCLGVPYFNWGPGYLELARQVADGTWSQAWEWAGPDWSDLNNHDTSAVGFEKGPALSADQSAQLDEFIAGLADGSISLFQGPLNYQDGSTFLADGQTATDQDIWYMPQLLQGMETLSE